MLSLLKTNLEVAHIRLVPYQQMSLASHPSISCNQDFMIPCEILAKIGPIAYKWKLPTTSKLHHVFHVSCLKKHLGAAIQPILFIHKWLLMLVFYKMHRQKDDQKGQYCSHWSVSSLLESYSRRSYLWNLLKFEDSIPWNGSVVMFFSCSTWVLHYF